MREETRRLRVVLMAAVYGQNSSFRRLMPRRKGRWYQRRRKYALFLFGPTSRVRMVARDIIDHRWSSGIIMLNVIVAFVFVITTLPGYPDPSSHQFHETHRVATRVVLAIYTIETALYICAEGGTHRRGDTGEGGGGLNKRWRHEWCLLGYVI